MRILIAPDSYKGTMSARAAAEAMAAGVRDAFGNDVEVDVCPIADGGEGTLDALQRAMPESFIRHTRMVCGPLGETVAADWGSIEENLRRASEPKDDHSQPKMLGIVEMAQASGMTLVPPHRRDPTQTTTYGTGELIRAAADYGCDAIIVAIGGSATCDGGIGMAQALGVRFFDVSGIMGLEPVDEREPVRVRPLTGEDLAQIRRIDATHRINLPSVRVGCDVDNPLCGPRGSAAVYGPQKGATPQQVEELDRGLANLAAHLPETDPDHPGSGAAGGIGFGLRAFLGAELTSGIALILDMISFRSRAESADLIITGEGRFDSQTLHGKAVAGVARMAEAVGVPVVIIAGTVQDPVPRVVESHDVIRQVIGLASRFGEQEAMSHPARCLREAARDVLAG